MTRLIAVVVIFFAFAHSAWANTFKDLDPYSQAPQVKKYLEAWKKCGAGGDACPTKESAAEASRLRDLALKDCFPAFGSQGLEKMNSCRAAVNATPGTFSTKPEPVKPPKPHPAVKPPDPIRVDPEEPSEPSEPTRAPAENVRDFVTHDELQDELRKALRDITPAPQPPAPPNNLPGWVLFMTLWNVVVGILCLGLIIYVWRKRSANSAVTQEQLGGALGLLIIREQFKDNLSALYQDKAGAQALQGGKRVFEGLKELEQQLLENLSSVNPQNPEIERMKGRIEELRFLLESTESALEQLTANLSPKQ